MKKIEIQYLGEKLVVDCPDGACSLNEIMGAINA